MALPLVADIPVQATKEVYNLSLDAMKKQARQPMIHERIRPPTSTRSP